ncbi:hypothetical protein ACHQM5_023171 [Ranunculus cassubicifolius]
MKHSLLITWAVSLLFLTTIIPPLSPVLGALLPFLSRHRNTAPRNVEPEFDFLPDPFRILEQIPFGIERDTDMAVSPARVDWKETPEAHFITMDLEIEENRMLRVSGERKKEEENKDDHWHRVERSYGKFWRQFRLPDNVDMDSIEAKLEDGVLTVSLAKLSPEKIKGPRVVTVNLHKDGDEHRHLTGEAQHKIIKGNQGETDNNTNQGEL